MLEDDKKNNMEKDSMDDTDMDEGGTSTRGFASMDEDKQREIASKGGKSQGKDVNPGNFANDREKAAAAGRIGGQRSHGGGRDSDSTDSNDSNDSEM